MGAPWLGEAFTSRSGRLWGYRTVERFHDDTRRWEMMTTAQSLTHPRRKIES